MIVYIIVICIILGGCMSRRGKLTKELGSEQQMADKMMADIVSALDNNDEDALKSLFSQKTIKEVDDLDQQILDIMNFYKGISRNYEGHIFSSNDIRDGKNVKKLIEGMYKLETEHGNYRIDFDYNPVDRENPNEVGLNSLELITEETYQKEVDINGSYNWQSGANGPGVYIKD